MQRRLAGVTLFLLAACGAFGESADEGKGDAGPVVDSSADAADSATNAMDAGAGDGDASSQSPYAQEVLKDNPLAYWRLGEDHTTVLDTSGKGHVGKDLGDCTLGAMGALARDPDKAVLFGGTNSHVRLDMGQVFGFEAKTPFTIELWAKPTVTDGVYRVLMSKALGVPRIGWVFLLSGVGLSFQRWVANGFESVTAPAGIPASKFSHVAVTFDGDTLKLYIDGKFVISAISPGDIPASDAGFVIGADKGGSVSSFNGVLDEVAIYDMPLSPQRISAHFAVAQ